MARWAVFDVDGTLLPRTSMERQFWRYLLGRRRLPVRNIFHFMTKGLAGLLKGDLDSVVKSNKSYVKDLNARDVGLLAADCYRRRIAPRLSPRGKEAVESLRRQGYKIMIISGGPDFLAEWLKIDYEPDLLVCSRLEVKSGRYTGRLSCPHPYGERKKRILAGLAEKKGLDFGRSVVFADHPSDISHLALFGRPVAVNPKGKLRRVARQRGWTIVSW
jgi:putative phosphoserine phosphatase/1-acylglycerol-3-phosphate O-acyltransferase